MRERLGINGTREHHCTGLRLERYILVNEPCHEKTGARSDTNQAVQAQKLARGLKFQIHEVKGLYYL